MKFSEALDCYMLAREQRLAIQNGARPSLHALKQAMNDEQEWARVLDETLAQAVINKETI